LVKIWCGLIKLKYRRFRISASCQCVHTNRNQSSPADSIPCFEANSCTGVWLEIVFWNIFPKSFKQLSITIYDLTLQNLDYSFYQRIPVNGKKPLLQLYQCTLHFEGMPLELNQRVLQQNVHGICTNISVNMWQTIWRQILTNWKDKAILCYLIIASVPQHIQIRSLHGNENAVIVISIPCTFVQSYIWSFCYLSLSAVHDF
jgi:hypothetical protein